MSRMNSTELKAILDELCAKHGVVGAAIGILSDGEIQTAGSGLLNISTGVEATADSGFQVGSITKVFTATLIMQLIDEGRLNLDDPVIKHLPDFVVANPAVSRSVTVRHLLNHTSGMDGDLFPADDPEGPLTAGYVRKMCLLPNVYLPGEGPPTYCNSGFVVAGRIVEVLTGATWQNAVMDRICRPLGMPVAFAHPHESLRFRCAMGHVPDPTDNKKSIVAPITYLPFGMASCGSGLTLSAESLLLFAKAHLADGKYGDGKQLLSTKSARAMREEKIGVPPFTITGVTHWGLGWYLGEGCNYRMAGHSGATAGQLSYMTIFPEHGVALAVLTNSPNGSKLAIEFETLLLKQTLGVLRNPEPPREDFKLEPERYLGTYETISMRSVVQLKDGNLVLRHGSKNEEAPPMEFGLEPYCPNVFALRGGSVVDAKAVFLEDDSGKAKFVRVGGRMARRQAEALS